MKAWIENNKIRDIAHDDPNLIYHPDVAVLYDTEVPDDAQSGWELINKKWTAPVIPVVEAVEPIKTISLDQIRNNLTFSEKVKWDNNKTDEITTAKIEFAQSLPIDAATEILQFLVNNETISQDSMNKIIG